MDTSSLRSVPRLSSLSGLAQLPPSPFVTDFAMSIDCAQFRRLLFLNDAEEGVCIETVKSEDGLHLVHSDDKDKVRGILQLRRIGALGIKVMFLLGISLGILRLLLAPGAIKLVMDRMMLRVGCWTLG